MENRELLSDQALEKLTKRVASGTYRDLVAIEEFEIDFASNDYLGLAKKANEENFITKNHGAGGSRLISGNYKRIHSLENDLASFYGYESALLFTSGYQANLGLISTIPQERDLILYDELCHASIRDAMRLSFARRIKFKHNDFSSIPKLVDKKNYKDLYIITEGLFSMDGDRPDFNYLSEIACSLNSKIIIDDSHGVGLSNNPILDPKNSHKIHKQLLACIIGFGKGLGAQGGVVLGGAKLKQYLINFARPFIFSTAPSIAQTNLIIHQHDWLEKNGEVLRKKLDETIEYFLSKIVGENNFFCRPNSPIQNYFCDSESLKMKQKLLYENKIFCKAIFPPTVPKGSERFRINLHAYNSKEEIDLLIKILTS